MRTIGLDVHKIFADAAILETGHPLARRRIATDPIAARTFVQTLSCDDRVVLEAAVNTSAIAASCGVGMSDMCQEGGRAIPLALDRGRGLRNGETLLNRHVLKGGGPEAQAPRARDAHGRGVLLVLALSRAGMLMNRRPV